MDIEILSQQIKAEAYRLGFSACGIARAQEVGESKKALKQWIDSGYHAGMLYMDNHFDKRCNPTLLVEGTKSIICVALNYYPQQRLKDNQLQFAYYAYGQDYHNVMKQKLTQLFEYINKLSPIKGRVFCDTAPVLERYWAQQSGIGWIGKNTQLIIPRAGSYFFLGELFIDMELDYDSPIKSRCGDCCLCLNTCPTKALRAPYQLDANRCISYLTIENKGEINAQYDIGNHLYGCDECQRCCPWNRFAEPHSVSEFNPSSAFLLMEKEDWNQLKVESYQAMFKGSAVKRAKFQGLMRNLAAINKK